MAKPEKTAAKKEQNKKRKTEEPALKLACVPNHVSQNDSEAVLG